MMLVGNNGVRFDVAEESLDGMWCWSQNGNEIYQDCVVEDWTCDMLYD